MAMLYLFTCILCLLLLLTLLAKNIYYVVLQSVWWFFYPRDAMLARVIAIATCPSVCLSVRSSVRQDGPLGSSAEDRLPSWLRQHHSLIGSFHDGMRAVVVENGERSADF